MVDSILDVARNLQVDQYTVRELNAWMKLRQNCRRNYILGSVGGGIAGWFAGQKLNIANRLFITAGTAIGCGYWALDWGLNSQIDCVLSLHGTRLQEELATSMLKRNHNHPKYKELIRKHFYPENVYDDSSDIPKLRWRWRNFFKDGAAAFEAVADDHNSTNNKSDLKSTVKKEANSGSKPAQINTSVELMDDPFDIIFGTPTGNGENQSSGGSDVPRSGRFNTTPKRHTHGSKRHHHRRRRKHHHEGSES